MKKLSDGLKIEISQFFMSLIDGDLEFDKWDYDKENIDWMVHQKAVLSPITMITTISIWLNNIELDEYDTLLNSDHATFRAFQYFRTQFDKTYLSKDIDHDFEDWELVEWHI